VMSQRPQEFQSRRQESSGVFQNTMHPAFAKCSD
jgi:hypothetical protein